MESNLKFNIQDASDSYIESYVKEFVETNISTINSLCFSTYKESSKLSLLAFQEIVSAELKKACYSFVNNNHNPDYINSYLFSCIHRTIKNLNNEYKSNAYICPACKFFSKIEVLEIKSKKLICNACQNSSTKADSEWEANLFKIFSEHSKKGYKCPDCGNFIPESDSGMISCPYPNCCFAGATAGVNSMRHPAIKTNLEIPMLNDITINQLSFDKRSNSDLTIIKDDFEEYIKILNDVIASQINLLHYKSNESTLKNKLCMYEAFKNIIEKFPEEMISYLVFLNRNVRIQHKIFQEFISILEKNIPFSFHKNGKFYEITSLVDENLCIFDGESEFISAVNENNEIPNETQELYVGGRKGSYCRPFYIGKVIDIIDIDTNKSLMPFMREFTFFKISMVKDIPVGTKVLVKHYRIPPHYQMGGMVYLNRIRRTIVDKVYLVINGKKRTIKR